MNESTSGLEKQMDNLLQKLSAQGALDSGLGDADLDQLMAAVPSVSLSTGFAQRAMAAMTRAQSEREQRSPGVALGALLARSRRRVKLELSQVAEQLSVPTTVLEALEVGQLSVRQVLHNFPPGTAARLLAVIKLTVQEFSSRLIDWAAAGGGTTDLATPQLAYRKRQLDSESLVKEVAEYITALEHSARS
jgi:hypothetical protein